MGIREIILLCYVTFQLVLEYLLLDVWTDRPIWMAGGQPENIAGLPINRFLLLTKDYCTVMGALQA